MNSPHPDLPSSAEPLHVLAGPTASGKTALALEVAERAGAELLSMDSMLVYRGMDVGTAKPTSSERARVPHHLLDLVDARSEFGVTDWLEAAREAQADLQRRGRRALFVGGTAFYLKALSSGLFGGPDPDRELRAGLERRYGELGGGVLHAELSAVDPVSAARLHANDRKRIVRALEVWQQTGRALSDWQQEWARRPQRPLRLVALTVEPARLRERIAGRTRGMLAAGWADEVRGLLAAGGLGATARQALGYGAVIELVEGRAGPDETAERITLRTQQFARKQRTWLRQFEERVEVRAGETESGDGADMQRAARETLAALGW